jgi:putative hemolysin
MSLLPWFVVLLLTAGNAVYVAAEFAAVAVHRSQLISSARAGDRRALALIETLRDRSTLDRYIAACQIGITLTSLVAGAYAQATIASDVARLLQGTLELGAGPARGVASGIVLFALSTLQIVFGELVPKSLALQYPARVALATFHPMRWSIALYRPFIWLLNGSGLLLLRPFGITPGGQPHVHSPHELELLFAESRRGGTLTPELYRRLRNVLRLSRRTVHQLMVPRSQLIAIEASTPDFEIVQRVLESPYSRLPVYRETIDNLLGTVNTRDIVASYVTVGRIPPLAELLRPIPFVPENLTADRLVHLLRRERTSKAVVVDEYGGVQGLISIDDLLAELFGDLGEELKPSRESAELLADGRVKLRGSMRPLEAEAWLGEAWEGAAATLSGLIMKRLGRLPNVGESIELGDAEFTVLEVGATSILAVAVRSRRDGAQPGVRQP